MMGDLLGYARVSTTAQDPQLQLDALTAAGCTRVFVDRVSGTRTERPELDRVLDHLRDNRDTLVVWRLDRLGRSLPHLVATVHSLQERGVGFRSLTESIDTTTATGRLIFHVFSSLAEFERDLLAERTRAGLEAARSKGRLGGRPSVMTPERLAVARQLLAEGNDVAAVARTIGVSRATIYRHADRAEPSPSASPAYIGARSPLSPPKGVG